MTFNAQKPRCEISLGSRTHVLEGTFGLLEAAEVSLQTGILEIANNVMDMPLYKFSRLLAAVLNTSGVPFKASEISEIIVNELGVVSEATMLLRLTLFGFLQVCMAKPSEREVKVKEMGELFQKFGVPQLSLGVNIDSSASVSLDGDLKTSGTPPSGM